MIEEIKQKISEGEIEEALKMLREDTVLDSKVNNQVIVILGRYNLWKNKYILGTNENDIELRKVEQSIMEILNALERNERLVNKYPKWFLDFSSFKFQIQISISISAPVTLLLLLFIYSIYPVSSGSCKSNATHSLSYDYHSTFSLVIAIILAFLFLMAYLIILPKFKIGLTTKIIFIFSIIMFIIQGPVQFLMSLLLGGVIFLTLFLSILFIIRLSKIFLLAYFHFRSRR